MKTLLAILSIFALSAVTSSSIVEASCTSNNKSGLGKIEYVLEGELTKKGERLTITLKDYPNLTNVKVDSSNGEILGVEGPNDNGVITIIANADKGSGIITITADGKQKLEIPIAINTRYEIQASMDKTTFRIGEKAILTIQEHTLLTGLQVVASPSGNVQISEIQNDGTVAIKGISEGTTTLKITATNGSGPKEFNLTIQPKVPIEATIDKTSLKIGEKAIITITNHTQFINLQISANPSNSLEIEPINDDNGTVTIKALKSGSTTITISADNGISKTLTIDIAARIGIDASLDNDKPKIGDTVNVKVTNFADLVNLQIKASHPDSVQIGAIDGQGNITVTILAGGNITLNITADNATAPWTATIIVQNKVDISANLDKSEIYTNNQAILTLNNYAELINPTIQASPSASVSIGAIDSQGKVEITGLVAGDVTLTIGADNANNPVELTLTIKPRITITATIDNTNLKVGQSTSIRITNPDQLLNLQVTANPSDSAEIGVITPDGVVNVKALKPGSITFTISADNGISKTLTLNVDQKIAITATIGDNNLWTGDNTTITITNYDQLVNAQITASPSENIQIGAIDDQGRATITAAKSGQATVTINADNASVPYQFILNIQDKIQIAASLDKNNLKIGETATLTITNYTQLQGASITANPGAKVEIGAINSQGIATIKALDSGSVTLTITADNGISQQLTLNIAVKITIQASIDNTTPWVGQLTTLTITNFDQLVNLQVQSIPSGAANIGAINSQGQIQINPGQTGQIQIKISADNAVSDQIITLTVSAKIQIEASIDKPSLKVGETATITVSNPENLVNLQAVGNPAGNVLIGPINPNGTISVKALNSGITTITLSADNGVNKVLSINIADKIAIQTTVNETNLWIGEIATITVTNFTSLVNLHASVDNSNLATISAIDGQGHLTLAAVGQGTVVVTLTADNATEPKTINFNLNQKLTIEASIDKTSLRIGETATISITNPSQLQGLTVTANPSGNVEIGPIQPDGTVTIKGIAAGATTITISAANGISKVLSVAIAEKIAINASADLTDLWIGKSATITISNFDQLANLTVTGNPSGNVQIGSINAQGQVQVTALEAGATTVTINADNATTPVDIVFNITPKVNIDAWISKTSAYVGDFIILSVDNYRELINLQITASPTGIVEVRPTVNGITNLFAIKAGTTTITIKADNGVDKTYNLTISDKIAINASIDKTNIKVGETATITIINPGQFENLQIVADPSGNVEISSIGSDGKVTVKALTSGTTTITISANNGINKTFTLTIADKIAIDATISMTDLWIGAGATLTVNNFDQLVNLQVKAEGTGSVNVGPINGSGALAIQALGVGNVQITVSADNAIENKIFNLTITPKIDIDATINKSNIWAGETATITINNDLSKLVNLRVSPSSDGIVQIGAINPNGTVNVQALSTGTVTITISADNGISKTLSLTISNKIVIDATIDKTNIKVGETATITITNPAQFTNLQVIASPSGNVQIGTINPDGTVSVKAMAAGTTTITITADNGVTKTLNLTIAAKIAIQASADQTSIYVGNTATITIANYASLVNVKAVADGGGKVSVGAINSQGQATVTGIGAGTGTVTITADNGIAPVIITFTTTAKLTINATLDKTTIRVGETATLTISNFVSLIGLQTTTSPNGVVSLGSMNGQGKITVTGLAAGTTTLSVTALNGITVNFNITVPALVAINATASDYSIPLLGTSVITIHNMSELVNVNAVVIQNPSLVSINLGDIQNGRISITAIGLLKGTIVLRITASNAIAPKDITISIGIL